MKDEIVKAFIESEVYYSLSKAILDDNVTDFIVELENFPEHIFISKICDNKNIIELCLSSSSKEILDFLFRDDKYYNFFYANLECLIKTKDLNTEKIITLIEKFDNCNNQSFYLSDEILKSIFYRNNKCFLDLLIDKKLINKSFYDSIAFNNILNFALKSKFGENIVFDFLNKNNLAHLFLIFENFALIKNQESFYKKEINFISKEINWDEFFKKLGIGSLISIFYELEDNNYEKKVIFFKEQVMNYAKTKKVELNIDYCVMNIDLLKTLMHTNIFEKYLQISIDEVELLFLLIKEQSEIIALTISSAFKEENMKVVDYLNTILQRVKMLEHLKDVPKNAKIII